MSLKIVLICDVHFDDAPVDHPNRRMTIGDVLLRRAVHRVNRFLQPDVVLILGDLVDGESPVGLDCLRRLREIIDLIEAPTIVIPGNHDPAPEVFYEEIGRRPASIDVKGVRIVPFVDLDEPGYNARRSEEGMDLMAEARAGFDGPIVAVQHVPVFPPGADACPYNHVDADRIIAAMKTHGISLALSGHWHEGMDLVRRDNLAFLAGPALCEEPFPFLEITIEGDAIEVYRHELRLPDSLLLTDTHVHTQFAYCADGVTIEKDLELAEAFGLAALRFTEHTGQLYFDADTFWKARFMPDGIAGARPEDRRLDAYLDAVRAQGCPEAWIGFEVDCDFRGRPVITPADRAQARFLIASMHWVPELMAPNPDLDKACDEFLAMFEGAVRSGVQALAHPFRVFHRIKTPPPQRLFGPMVRRLREEGVAAELNFHNQTPPREFVRQCLDADVKLTLGSDAHRPYEVGDLWPHLRFLEDLGVTTNISDVLLRA